MTSPYSQFKVDENIQRAGIKLDYDGYYFIITHAGQSNKKYTLKEREMIRKNRSAINTNTLTPEQDNKLMAQLYADSVILGWGSDEHGDGYLADE
nr:hypothetical protein [Nitrosopumilaceae archaeon]NIU87935.1 hypothetical protein [Nitrosopumilaceae archaeon]NIV66215.1 hypothetical protein [Nitrosopumilaceae archaeon]NIX62112.1 hypothetical protein [Nitrosopumilaceae archaeon]